MLKIGLYIIYHLYKNTKKCLVSKSASVTLLPVTEGDPFFVHLCVMHF